MRWVSSLPPSAEVSRSKLKDVSSAQGAPRPRRTPPLPVYVAPAADEALLSWLLRLATRLHVSFHTLAGRSFGIDDRSGDTRWWCRPNRWSLARISERTDVSVERLRRMTLEGLEPTYRDDEASARFTGRRYDGAVPDRRGYRFAVCGRCLQGDAHPYVRSAWLLGWMAVCPIHGTILIERCPSCGAGLRAPPFTAASAFSPVACTRCSKSILGNSDRGAHPSVIHLQAALCRGKRDGVLDLRDLGRLTWKEMIALADVLVGMVWTDLTLGDQEKIFSAFAAGTANERREEDSIYDCRHGSLHFLCWLIAGWPDSPGAVHGRHLLIRWFTAERNRLCRHLRPASADPWCAGANNFEPSIRERLRMLTGAV
jgi:TniQ